MKNIVTFETAQRLKEAGFPQPEPERGQVWYNETGEEYFITNTGGACVDYACGDYWYVDRSLSADGCVFAPTATDILQNLPIQYEMYYSEREGCFFTHCRSDDGFIVPFYYHINPAEAAAAAWLELNQTT